MSRLYKMTTAAIEHLKDAANLSEIETHTLYTRFLTKDSLVIDLGANVGHFSLAIVEKIGATIYALEALPSTFAKIPDHPRVKKYNRAITDQDGPVRLFVSDNPETTSVHRSIAERFGVRGEEACPGITFEHFLQTEGIKRIDLLKVDIEGSEEALFETTSDETLRNICQITIEFHDFIQAHTVRRITTRLKSLGFLCLPFWRHYDVLFIRTDATNIHPDDHVYFRQLKAILELKKSKASALALARKHFIWR
jgi:FkbM family methyltransferase